MSSICEQYVTEYDILFNISKSKLLFFKGRCCDVSTLSIVVCGQLVEMSDIAVHLGHTITSKDRYNITTSAKSKFWKSLNILLAEFGKLSSFVISKLFNQFCCTFLRIPFVVQQWCSYSGVVCWLEKSIESFRRLNPRTHCDLIIALSSQVTSAC